MMGWVAGGAKGNSIVARESWLASGPGSSGRALGLGVVAGDDGFRGLQFGAPQWPCPPGAVQTVGTRSCLVSCRGWRAEKDKDARSDAGCRRRAGQGANLDWGAARLISDDNSRRTRRATCRARVVVKSTDI